VILCANDDTYKILNKDYSDKIKIHLETGIGEEELIEKSNVGASTSFVQVGNLEARKGWRITILAVDKLVNEKKINDFKVEFIGGGCDLDKAKQLVDSLGLSDFIIFHGKKNLAETKNKLAKSRALLFPSVRDTSGNVVLEAMSKAVPVIGFNHQGVKEMLTKDCGILIEPSNLETSVNDMADAIIKLNSNDQLSHEMGLAGRNRIRNHFIWPMKRDFMQSIYDTIIEKECQTKN